jgi:molybdopterin molybdotransferase
MIDMGVVKDDPLQLEQAFTHAAQQADAIITSGGVSVGEADFTKAMMKQLGDVAFWQNCHATGSAHGGGSNCARRQISGVVWLARQPRGRHGDVFGVRQASTSTDDGLQHTAAALDARQNQRGSTKKPGRTEYQRGIVSRNLQGDLEVITTGNQGSGVLSSMVQANALIVLHHTQSTAQIGDWVDVLML